MLGWASCDTAPYEAGRREITNGVPAEGDLGVVAILDDSRLVCTGTLISPRVVLTAGHCVEPARPPAVFFGEAVDDGGIVVTGAHARRHARYRPAPLEHDLALVVLEAPAPPGSIPPALNVAPIDDSTIDAPLRIVGFGRTDAGDLAAGVKHEGVARLLDYEETTFRLGANPSQTCVGDSGGPVFLDVDGVETLAGVTSSGDPACVEFGRSTRVDAYAADFIEPFLAATADGAAEPGDPCYHDDHCAAGACLPAEDDDRLRFCSPPCGDDRDCPAGMRCAGDDRCRYPPPSPGSLDTPCEEPHQCAEAVCAATEAAAPGRCSSECVPGFVACPDGYDCSPNARSPGQSACFASGGGCGCTSGDRRPAPTLLIAIIALALLLHRAPRRRRAEGT